MYMIVEGSLEVKLPTICRDGKAESLTYTQGLDSRGLDSRGLVFKLSELIPLS